MKENKLFLCPEFAETCVVTDFVKGALSTVITVRTFSQKEGASPSQGDFANTLIVVSETQSAL